MKVIKATMEGLTMLSIYLGGFALYVMNIVQMFQNDYSTLTLVFKVIGMLLPPVGIVMGVIG